jgi:hypothetical protein
MRSTGAAEPAPTIGDPGGALAAASSAPAGTRAGGSGAGPAVSVIPGVAEQVRSTPIPKTPPAARAEPSWGQVVATTVSLWLSRRMPRARADRGRRGGLGRPSWPLSRLSRRAARGLRLAALVLALAAVAVTALRFTGTSAATVRSSSPGHIHPASAAAVQAQAARAQAARAQAARAQAARVQAARVQAARAQAARAQAARVQAAAWIAGQVSSDEIIGCDPAMCAALQAHGVAAGRLRLVGPATTGLAGLPDAGLIVASPLVRSQFGSRLGDSAPVLLASFGSGASLIDVRAAFPGGAAAYDSAVKADAAARESAGAQLLRSQRIMVSPQGAAQLRAGEVDSRLLVMLAALASLQRLRVVAFGDASPGAQVPSADLPLREVTITSAGGRGGAAALAPVLAMVRAQRATYQPAFASIVDSAAGQPELMIEFAAPSPLGLLEGGN